MHDALQHRTQGLRLLRCFVLAFSLAVLASACSRTPPEQAILENLDAMQSAIAARDAGAVDALLADDFIGSDGLDREGARRLAAVMFLQYRDVSVKLGPATVELRGDRNAMAHFTVLATGGSGGLLPDSGQAYEVETGWRMAGGGWKLLSAEWKPKL